MSQPDWSRIQAFLAVAEEGSLSAAARKLGTSQPTLGRQVKALEAELGAELFRRVPKGLELTEIGAEMLPPAREMAEAMARIALAAAGRQSRLAGPVRITASRVISYFVLPQMLVALREEEPEITFDVVPSDATSNLLFREADIAIRMYRPAQLDLVTRYLGDIPLAAFAAKSYLARHGTPDPGQPPTDHRFVGYDRDPAIRDGFRQAGIDVPPEFFALRCDDNLGYWALVRAGGGIGFGQATVGRADPTLEEVDLGFPLPSLPVWLTAHEAMRRTPRIRRVWDHLAAGLSAHVAGAAAAAP